MEKNKMNDKDFFDDFKGVNESDVWIKGEMTGPTIYEGVDVYDLQKRIEEFEYSLKVMRSSIKIDHNSFLCMIFLLVLMHAYHFFN